MSFIPDELTRTTMELRGAAGADWLKRLPAIVAGCERRWSLAVGPPFPELSATTWPPRYAPTARRPS